MRAMVIREPGGPEVLEFQERPAPMPGPEDVTIRVHASGLNRADLLQRLGRYPAPPGCPPDIPGLELAGEVISVGEQVTRFKPGDPVMGIVGGGGCAELATLHQDVALPIPAGMSWEDAAAIPEAFLTAYDAVVIQGGLTRGDWLVSNAVASGVGTAATQIARVTGAHTVGSSRTASKLEASCELGLDHPVHGSSEDLPDVVREVTGGGGAQVAMDLVGGPGLSSMIRCLSPRGTLVLVGLLGGARAELDLGRLLMRRLCLRGTVLRSRSTVEKASLSQTFADHLLSRFEGDNPTLRPVVSRTLSWTEAGVGHSLLEQGETIGKVVLIHDR